MTTRLLFEKYQEYLVSFANSFVGRAFLHTRNLPVIKVCPESIHYFDGFTDSKCQNARVVAVFYSKPEYAHKLELALTALDIAKESFNFSKYFDKPDLAWTVIAHFIGMENSKYLPSVMFTTGTFRPDANPETDTFDGYTGFDYANTEYSGWAAHRGAATAGSSSFYLNDSGTLIYLDVSDPNSNNKFSIVRAFMLFNTSSLGSGATISSASWHWQYYSVAVDSTSYSWVNKLYLTTSSPASNTSLVVGDFDQIGFTAQADPQTSVSTKSTNTDYSFALNATGLSNISKTSITKFGLSQGNDFENTDPNASAGGSFRLNIYSADYTTDLNKRHYLEVIYTLPFSPTKRSLINQAIHRSNYY